MDERQAPFHYGSPVSGEDFVDREDELSAISGRMLNGINVILLSPRRYGKTSLLLEAIRRVRKRGGRSGYASLVLCTSGREVAETLLAAVLNGPLSWLATQRHNLGQLLGRVRLQPQLEFNQVGELKISLEAHRADEDWRHVTSTVLRLLADAETGRRPVSLVIDEFQQVAEIDPGLPGLFKVMADELQHVSLVFSGSRMHVMRRIAVGPSAPLMGMGEQITLRVIPEDLMVKFLVRRAGSADKQLGEADARKIYRLADGIPNDVQRLAFEASVIASEAIGESTIDAAMNRIIAHRSVDYAEKFVDLAPSQQRLLKAFAREPRGSLYTRSFLAEVDAAHTNSVRKALDVLEDKELVARREANWTVADPFFRAWLREGPA